MYNSSQYEWQLPRDFYVFSVGSLLGVQLVLQVELSLEEIHVGEGLALVGGSQGRVIRVPTHFSLSNEMDRRV